MDYFKEVDADVLIRLQLGDEGAFRIIYDNYAPRLYSFAYHFLKDREFSEEVVQESLLKLWVNRARIDPGRPLGPYIYTFAKRLSLNLMRHATNSSRMQTHIRQNVKEGHNETEEHILFNDLNLFTESILTALPQKQQEVFRLSRHQGLSHKQIAKHLALSENTVRNHIAAALKKMQVRFDQSYLFVIAFFLFK